MSLLKFAANIENILGIKIFIIPNLYAGLYNLIEFDYCLIELTKERVSNFSSILANPEDGNSIVNKKNRR